MVREYINLLEISKEVMTRSKALEKGLKHFYSGKACPKGHLDLRYVSHSNCVSCARDYSKRQRENSPEKVKEYWESWYSRNSEYVKKKALDKYYEDPQKSRDYVVNNRARYRTYYAKRRGLKKSATPAWLNADDLWMIQEVYELSELRTRITSVEHQVDHIIPLQNKKVCGLHVPWNLQVLTKRENQTKSNKFVTS